MRADEKRLGRQTRAWAAALAVAAVGVGASASTALAVPSNFWGVASQATPSLEQLQRLKRGGVDSIRVPIFWASVQPQRNGALDWSPVDAYVEHAAGAGIDMLPFFYGAPTWAVRSAVVDKRNGSRAPLTLPVRNRKQRSGWKSLLRQAANRYGPRGSFWAEHPGVPKRPFRIWQIWNEENFKYFVARPNPIDYGKLVKLSHAALRGVDPGARVVLGGMFARPEEALIKRGPRQAYFATEFLNQMYKRTPGIKSKFHGVALHPYTGTFKRLPRYIEDIRRVLKANRDAGKGLWLTELGWSSGRPERGNDFAKGRKGQAKQLKGAFRLLRNKQKKWRIKRVYWFSVDDQIGSCNFCDGSGLFGAGFVPKPSWFAFTRFAGGQPN